MGAEHKLAIFRGLLKFKSNEQKIWGVLIFLSIVTVIEVGLGITNPAFLLESFYSYHIPYNLQIYLKYDIYYL